MTRLIETLDTCYGQTLRAGVQVAYTTKTEVNATSGSSTNRDDIHIQIKVSRLKVANIVQIEEKSAGFAECDGLYELLLDDGARVYAEDVAVTDGQFKYGSR